MNVPKLSRLIAACALPAFALPGCAQHPLVSTTVTSPAIGSARDGEKTYALLPPETGAAASAAPVIERRLQELGFRPSATPAFLVETRATQRPHPVGAFVAGPDGSPGWVEMPQPARASSKRTVLSLSVRILDAGTLTPAYAATASLSGFKGAPGKAAPRLTAAALDPLR